MSPITPAEAPLEFCVSTAILSFHLQFGGDRSDFLIYKCSYFALTPKLHQSENYWPLKELFPTLRRLVNAV